MHEDSRAKECRFWCLFSQTFLIMFLILMAFWTIQIITDLPRKETRESDKEINIHIIYIKTEDNSSQSFFKSK